MQGCALSAILLNAPKLQANWHDCSAWHILDTRFGAGLDFLTVWQAWRCDTARPSRLHYVALTDNPVTLAELLACAVGDAGKQALVSDLAVHWFGLTPGFHRFSFDDERVLLTLCVGELSPMLRQQQFLADAIHLKPGLDERPWDIWVVKSLVRCCRRGTRLVGTDLRSGLRSHLTQCGFEFDLRQDHDSALSANSDRDSAPVVEGQFNPHWVVKHSRSGPAAPRPSPHHLQTSGTCTVIGAGLAGAGVAAALARRDWQVQVLDAGQAPASGASGLPVGLIVPHVSVDDCTLSRLSRGGVRLMLQQAQRLLIQGQDWDATGTLERRFNSTAGIAWNRTQAEMAWSRLATQEPLAADWLRAAGHSEAELDQALWHTQAAWLKPAQLVQAWLAQPGITFRGKTTVAGLRREGKAWATLDAAGQVLTRTDRVVVANAMGALPLMASLQEQDLAMAPLPALQGVRGQLSWGLRAGLPDHVMPPFPVNGSGSLVPQVPSAAGPAWFAGANYQPETQALCSLAANHSENLARLANLLPLLGEALTPRFAQGSVNSWENTRCVTTDRLPLVGPLTAITADEVQSSVWLCVGMGSRGLTFSALCAELLAAQWHGEPLPIEASLATALGAQRHAERFLKK